MVKEWFVFAIRDYKMAVAVSKLDMPQFKNEIAYHAQQCAEKAIKGFLVANDIRPIHRHDISELAEQVNTVDTSIALEISKARRLTDFAVGYRYPDAQKKPMTVAKAKTAIKLAKRVYDVCYQSVYSQS